MRMLVVEDNPKMSASLQKALGGEPFEVDTIATGREAEEFAVKREYAAIVLDVMLPDRDGVDVCRSLRRRGVSTPILMLTALGSTSDRVAGLDAGADDYLPKPFELTEFLARIRALVRRGQRQETNTLEYRDLSLDLTRRTATRAGCPIALSAKEFALVELLMRNPDRNISRETIGRQVWDINFEVTSNVVDVYISAIRKKLDRDFETKLIHTVVGSGYRLGTDDEEADESA